MSKAVAFTYLITNKVNDKKYVGWTLNPYRRWSAHIQAARSGDQRKFYSALCKYGVKNFILKVVFSGSVAAANRMEVKLIKTYDAFRNGYNSTLGGDG